MVRHISQRFRNVVEIPLFWKQFTLYHRPYLKRHHMGIMENLLKMIGEHVRKMYIGAVTSTALGMVNNCRNVTHLILYDKFSPLWVVKAMPHLQYLELIPEVGGYYYCSYDDKNDYYAGIEDTIELLKIIPVSVKKLDLVLSSPIDLEPIVTGIQAFANEHYALPSIINIFGEFNITATDNHTYDRTREYYCMGRHWQRRGFNLPVKNLPANHTDNLFEFWSMSAFNLSSFEIRLYDRVPILMNLFPPVPVRNYRFGAAATPTLIQLRDYGIVGLKDNIFHFSEYIDDRGMVCHAVTLDHGDCGSLIEERHITCTPHLHIVSYVDISYQNVSSNHLQQLAVACPNLQQLHLRGNVNCLEDLQGLQAVVDKCKNLKSLNLAGISVYWVECYFLLWDLLSNLKKLTLLTIDLCMILLYDYDDDDKQELVTMCKSCHSLLALNVHLGQESCSGCNSSKINLLFSHFPSLKYCVLSQWDYTEINHRRIVMETLAACKNITVYD